MISKKNKRWMVFGAQGVALTALVAGTVGFVGANKTVALTVDGQTQQVQTYGSTVRDALKAGDVQVDGDDLVSPGLDAPIQNGGTVDVRLARAVTVMVDGKPRQVTTTALTVDDLARELGIDSGSKLSLHDDMLLASATTPLSVTTPKEVKVDLAGKKKTVTTTALDVDALLSELGASPDADDKVSPSGNTVVQDGMDVKFTDVTTRRETKSKALDFETKKVKDAKLEKGKTKTQTEGEAGKEETVFELVLENGQEVSRKKVSTKTVDAPVTEIVRVGTKKAAEPKDDPADSKDTGSAKTDKKSDANVNGGVWDKIAKCESGGNWSINTGNGYYGGLQFNIGTWKAYGGSGLPSSASKSTQIAIAKKVQAKQGWGAWPACTSALGLR